MILNAASIIPKANSVSGGFTIDWSGDYTEGMHKLRGAILDDSTKGKYHVVLSVREKTLHTETPPHFFYRTNIMHFES
ncbi:hypothetical protein GCK32_019729, partial [Trichostrongylus colubriformis]